MKIKIVIKIGRLWLKLCYNKINCYHKIYFDNYVVIQQENNQLNRCYFSAILVFPDEVNLRRYSLRKWIHPPVILRKEYLRGHITSPLVNAFIYFFRNVFNNKRTYNKHYPTNNIISYLKKFKLTFVSYNIFYVFVVADFCYIFSCPLAFIFDLVLKLKKIQVYKIYPIFFLFTSIVIQQISILISFIVLGNFAKLIESLLYKILYQYVSIFLFIYQQGSINKRYTSSNLLCNYYIAQSKGMVKYV